jgi:Ca2+/Na+ antiporter
MNGNRKKTGVPAWRLVGIPIFVTFVAVAFWMEYYGTVGWWPVVLFVIWAAHYARYTVKIREEEDS